MFLAVLAFTMLQHVSAQSCMDSSCFSEGLTALQEAKSGLMALQKAKSEVTSAFRNDEDDAKHMHETHEDPDAETDFALYDPLRTGPPPDPDGSHAPLNETIPPNEAALLERGAARRRRNWSTCAGVCSHGWCYVHWIKRTWCYCNPEKVSTWWPQKNIVKHGMRQHCTGSSGWR